jgi:large subunit ribosomal protein L6
MSRIGKLPIELPKGVTMTLTEQVITVKGPKGELTQHIPAGPGLELEDGKAIITRPSEAKQDRANHGLVRSLAANMVEGVTKGFEKVLEIHGIGFKADVSGSTLTLGIGFSHPIDFPIPQGVTIEVQPGQPMKLFVRGIDKQVVGQAAATIRSYRPPDSYKGKGVRYQGEYVRIKAGKSAT